jgi:hypothetical protein
MPLAASSGVSCSGISCLLSSIFLDSYGDLLYIRVNQKRVELGDVNAFVDLGISRWSLFKRVTGVR